MYVQFIVKFLSNNGVWTFIFVYIYEYDRETQIYGIVNYYTSQSQIHGDILRWALKL